MLVPLRPQPSMRQLRTVVPVLPVRKLYGPRLEIQEVEATEADVLSPRCELESVRKRRPGVHEAVKFATFPAGVDAARQIGEQAGVEFASQKGRIELLGIHAGEDGAVAGRHEGLGQFRGGFLPQGKARLEPE